MLASQFTAYGPSHWAVIAVFVIGAVVLVWVGRRQTERQARLLGRVLGALTALVYAAILVYVLTPPTLDSVPLQLTDLAGGGHDADVGAGLQPAYPGLPAQQPGQRGLGRYDHVGHRRV